MNLQHSSGFSVLLNRPGRSTGNPFGYADSGFTVTLDDAAANGDIHDYQNVTVPGAGSPLTGTWQPDARNVDPADAMDTTSRTAYLSSFDGLDANGDWTLFLADIEYGAASTLDSWSLEVTGLEVIPEPTNVALAIFGSLAAGWVGMQKLRARHRRALNRTSTPWTNDA